MGSTTSDEILRAYSRPSFRLVEAYRYYSFFRQIFFSGHDDLEPGRSPRMSAVNTDMLGEEQCRRLCREATTHAVSKATLRYLEDTDTGKLKFYTLDRETEDGRSLRSVVQAFRCPTEPAIYLHISVRDDGHHVVWIIEQIFVPSTPDEMFPPVEFLTFDVKLVKSITEGNPAHLPLCTLHSASSFRPGDTARTLSLVYLCRTFRDSD